MINNLSNRITQKLIAKGTITEDERELYVYGFFVLLSTLMYFLLTLVLGLIAGCFLESVIFFAAFQFIRKYAGGYHASTETRCEIFSSVTIAVSIGLIRLADIYEFHNALLIISAAAAACIFLLCPLDTPEKPLSEKEFKYFRRISWLILAVIAAVIILSYLFRLWVIFTPCCIGLTLECLLLGAGRIKKAFTKPTHNNV